MDQLGSVPPLSISALSIHNTTTTENAVTGWNTPNYTTTTIFHLDSDLDQAVIHTQHPTTFVKQRKLKRRKKKKRRKGKTTNDLSNPIDRGPNTFGVGDRNIYPLSPYRNVDVNIDLSMDRSIQPETTASGNFVSTSPRFVVRTSISESESGNAKRNRLVQENMEKIKKRIDGPKPLRSTAAQDALLDGVAMLQASSQALAKIDQDPLEYNIDTQRSILSKLDVEFDQWFSEKTIHGSGLIEKTLDKLKDKNLTVEREGALWFKTTEFGDDKDRVLIKNDGQYTYFAVDCAYHFHKIDRHYDQLINLFGADHHGYIKRMEACGAEAYLVNTGWNGSGKRISIQDTRGIIDAILDGSIEQADRKIIPLFNL